MITRLTRALFWPKFSLQCTVCFCHTHPEWDLSQVHHKSSDTHDVCFYENQVNLKSVNSLKYSDVLPDLPVMMMKR